MGKLEELFEDLLPTKWSRRFAIYGVICAMAMFGLPSILPASYLPTAPEQVFLIRLILFVTTLFLGAVAALISVVRAYRVQTTAHNTVLAQQAKANETALEEMGRAHATALAATSANPSYPARRATEILSKMSEAHASVLGMLFVAPRTVRMVSEGQHISDEHALFYLTDLVNWEYAVPPPAYGSGPEQWRIGQNGRRYVLTNPSGEDATS